MVTIRDITQAIGKRLMFSQLSTDDNRLLLGFEENVYCQFRIDVGYDEEDYGLEQDKVFRWENYYGETLVQNGVLTSERVAEQKEQKRKKTMEETERRERDMLTLLKKKYEGQP